MQIDIDIESLSSDERYHLAKGLKEINSPSQTCKKALSQLQHLSNESFNKFLREHPEAIF